MNSRDAYLQMISPSPPVDTWCLHSPSWRCIWKVHKTGTAIWKNWRFLKISKNRDSMLRNKNVHCHCLPSFLNPTSTASQRVFNSKFDIFSIIGNFNRKIKTEKNGSGISGEWKGKIIKRRAKTAGRSNSDCLSIGFGATAQILRFRITF